MAYRWHIYICIFYRVFVPGDVMETSMFPHMFDPNVGLFCSLCIPYSNIIYFLSTDVDNVNHNTLNILITFMK